MKEKNVKIISSDEAMAKRFISDMKILIIFTCTVVIRTL